MRDLGEAVVAEAARWTLPRRLAEVEEGRTVRFGPFTVSWAGVGMEGEVAPWGSVGEAGIAGGLVYVRRLDGEPPMSAAVGFVPDAPVFTELCRRARATAGRAQARRAER